MLFAPGEALAASSADVPAALVPPGALARAMAVAERLPAASLTVMLECRLGPGQERVDLSTSIHRDGAHRLLAHARARGRSRPPLSRSGTGARILDFCAEWAEPSSPLHEAVPFCWLEFDLDGPRRAPPRPFLLFYLQPDGDGFGMLRTETRLKGERVTARGCHATLKRALPLLLGRPLSAGLEARVSACLEALPPGGFLAYAAPLLSRPGERIRLHLVVPAGRMPAYLRGLGFDTVQLGKVLAAVPTPPGDTWFELDVGEGPLSTVGVVLHYPPDAPDWRRMFDGLLGLGLCTREKREGALAWPGRRTVRLAGRKWPVAVQRGLIAKLVFRPDAAPEAKLYLDVGCRFSLFG